MIRNLVILLLLFPGLANAGIGSMIGGEMTSFGNWISGAGSKLSNPVANAQPATVQPATSDSCDLVGEQNYMKTQIGAQLDQVKPSPSAISGLSCLSNFKNFSISTGLGMPSLDTLLSSLESQVCNVAQGVVNQATAPLNQSLWLPGGVGVNTNALSGGSNPSGSLINTTTTTTTPGLPAIATPNLHVPSFSMPNITMPTLIK